MKLKDAKRKLKRRGEDNYNKYLFNPIEVINTIVERIDNNLPIREKDYDVKFDIKNSSMEQIYELITYYPNKIKEKGYIDDAFVDYMYKVYGETIEIMKEFTENGNVRGKILNGSRLRGIRETIEHNIMSEDIILVRECPIFGVKLKYGLNKCDKYSPSIDRIDPNKGYTRDNIRVISMLSNQMKSNATEEELILFATNILKQYNITPY